MQRTLELKVDERRYSTTHYPGTDGAKLFWKLIGLIGNPLDIVCKSDPNKEVDLGFIASILTALSTQLNPDEFHKLTLEVLCTTSVIEDNGSRRDIIYDTDFAGRYFHLFKLLAAVLKFQFDEVFTELAAAGKKAQRPAINDGQKITAK